jgi:pSer/pThr/pTyr-binding forkhead associated (FHA) protein
LHAILKQEGGQAVMIDLASANGTYVNGRRLPANLEQPIRHGDVISLGKLRAQFLVHHLEKE